MSALERAHSRCLIAVVHACCRPARVTGRAAGDGRGLQPDRPIHAAQSIRRCPNLAERHLPRRDQPRGREAIARIRGYGQGQGRLGVLARSVVSRRVLLGQRQQSGGRALGRSRNARCAGRLRRNLRDRRGRRTRADDPRGRVRTRRARLRRDRTGFTRSRASFAGSSSGIRIRMSGS